MKKIIRALTLIPLLLSAAGCISLKSYVDPSFSKTTYNDLRRTTAEPPKWKITVEFQRQGAPYPRVDSTLRQQVELVVRGSGMAIPADDAAGGTLNVVLNNFGDTGAAVAKGFGTGLTFGLAGSTVADYYEMAVTLADNGKTTTKGGYKAAIYSTIGNADGPPGLEPLAPSAAFSKVVEQMLLNALADLQKEGVPISSNSATQNRSAENLL